MNGDPLPPDLRELEARLTRRPGLEPSSELKVCVLGAAGEIRSPRRGSAWRLAGWAAAVVLLLNIGLSIANASRFHRLAEVTNVEQPAPSPTMRDESDPFENYAAGAVASLSPSPNVGLPDRSLFSR